MDSKKQNKENEFVKGLVDDEAMKRALDVPTQAFDILVDSSKKIQEASLDYFRQIEKIQREHWQDMTKVMSTVLPGESKLWEAQTKMIENSFDMMDRLMAVGKKA